MKRKLMVMLAVLRGESVMYRMHVHGTIMMAGPGSHTTMVECKLCGPDPAVSDFKIPLTWPLS